MAEIKEGTTVKLKSGGPLMTIQEIMGNDEFQEAICVWIDSDGKPHKHNYPLSVLEPDDGTLSF